MKLRLLQEATLEPVSLDEIKTHCRLSTTDTSEDSLLLSMEKSARYMGENLTKRAFIPHQYELSFDEFPGDSITLPISPLATVSTAVTITYLDSSGNSQTLSATYYDIDDRSEPAVISLSSNNEWPDTYEKPNAVTVTYWTGYPLATTGTASTVTTPEPIKSWIKLRVGALYENRESMAPAVTAGIKELDHSFVDGLLDPYVIIEVP